MTQDVFAVVIGEVSTAIVPENVLESFLGQEALSRVRSAGDVPSAIDTELAAVGCRTEWVPGERCWVLRSIEPVEPRAP